MDAVDEVKSRLSIEDVIGDYTNPILLEDAPERRILEWHGMEVAVDGLELRI